MPPCYTIDVEPPKRSHFVDQVQFFSKESEYYRMVKDKAFQFYTRKTERKHKEIGFVSEAKNEYEIREIFLNDRGSGGGKRKRGGGGTRGQNYMPVNRNRTFYHSRTGQVMKKAEVENDCDSDKEGDVNYHSFVVSCIDKIRLREEVSGFMKRWNDVVLSVASPPVQDKQVYDLALKFAAQLKGEDERTKTCFVQQVLVLWDHAMLTKAEARTLIDIVTT